MGTGVSIGPSMGRTGVCGEISTVPRAHGEGAATGAADPFRTGTSRDIPIGRSGPHRGLPMATRSEKPILERRHRVQQFYPEMPDSPI